jgi:hypothetical protein
MPITPGKARKLTELEESKMKELESYIDSKILKAYENNLESTINRNGINVSPPTYMTIRMRTYIEQLYENAGWDVSYHECQRDGEWFKFRPKCYQDSKDEYPYENWFHGNLDDDLR